MSVNLWRCFKVYVLTALGVGLAMAALTFLGLSVPPLVPTLVAVIMVAHVEAAHLAGEYEEIMPKSRAWREAARITALIAGCNFVMLMVLIPLGVMGPILSMAHMLLIFGIMFLLLLPVFFVSRFFLRFFMKQRIKQIMGNPT